MGVGCQGFGVLWEVALVGLCTCPGFGILMEGRALASSNQAFLRNTMFVPIHRRFNFRSALI